VPTRRSTAGAFHILISHAFGDAGSPYLVGVISEAIKPSLRAANQTSMEISDSTEIQFTALQYSLYFTVIVEALGGIFFLLTAIYVLRDRANVDQAVAGET
jgi:MFS transporter, Spinster family, sphingosine-1-phosphate transporter